MDVEARHVRALPGRSAAVRRPGVSKQVRTDLHGYAFAIPFLIVYGLFTLWPIIAGLRRGQMAGEHGLEGRAGIRLEG